MKHWLNEEAVPPSSTVAVRGFALTWIDATLTLFEGRGGRFEPVGQGPALRYLAGAGDVRTVFPFSRTGRPLLAKPDGQRIVFSRPLASDLEAIWEEGRNELTRLSFSGEAATASILQLVAAAAAQALRRVEGPSSSARSREIERLLQERCDNPPPYLDGAAVAQQMRHAWEVAVGIRPLDALWALGQAWRGLYPALVQRVSHGGLPTAAWPSFARLGREMERIAFGPPALNVAKILALLDTGHIDLNFVQNATLSFEGPSLEDTSLEDTSLEDTSLEDTSSEDDQPRLSLRGKQRSVDRGIHAVLRPPGVPPTRDTILGRLLDDGHARQLAGTSGIEITPSGQCVDRNGHPTPGLSVLGRATEGCVLGNDTLSRTLHRHPDAWAQRVVARFTEIRKPR